MPLPSSGLVRAVFAGDAARPRVESSPVAVKLVPSLRVAISGARVPRRSVVTVTGTMAPAQPAVTVVLERRAGRRWVRTQRKRVALANGGFAASFRPLRQGRYRVSVTGGGLTRRRRLTVLSRTA
jgi:hypothetical protein